MRRGALTLPCARLRARFRARQASVDLAYNLTLEEDLYNRPGGLAGAPARAAMPLPAPVVPCMLRRLVCMRSYTQRPGRRVLCRTRVCPARTHTRAPARRNLQACGALSSAAGCWTCCPRTPRASAPAAWASWRWRCGRRCRAACSCRTSHRRRTWLTQQWPRCTFPISWTAASRAWPRSAHAIRAHRPLTRAARAQAPLPRPALHRRLGGCAARRGGHARARARRRGRGGAGRDRGTAAAAAAHAASGPQR